MPVYTLECPDCGHVFRGMVMVGTRPPDVWICSACRSEKAAVRTDRPIEVHPLERDDHGGGCPCCVG